ncbi:MULTISPECIES: lytic polysaccharide monooxygenase [Pseudomonas]|nr:lytic polysaccharide monooxygenase [Pseudomonas sp. OVF7]WLD67568.1 lytic polysaccharide monooxygenase [Pseudomonas sp. OVF7]
MNNYAKRLCTWTLAALCLAPALSWAHGAVDQPISRQVYCRTLPDFWSGNPSDAGCAALAKKSGQYPGQQWNEVAHLIKEPGYNDPETVKREVPDGTLCAAADIKKDGLNIVSDDWYRTDVVPSNGMIDVRIIGTAPHVPSFAKVFLTRPGFDPTRSPLTWNDLVLIHTEQLPTAQTNWGSNPPALPSSGYFKFPVPIPSGQIGKATLFVQWQRIDPAGEGFYNCSDINIAGGGVPAPWVDLGQFIDAVMNELKAGDSVHFRILDNTPQAKEVVDITLPITPSNLDPKIWGRQLADQINPSIAKVGEKQGSNIVFNPTDPSVNSVFTTAKGYSKAMAIIPGGEKPIDPRAPEAVIDSHAPVKSGDTFTMNGRNSKFYNNGPIRWQWDNDFLGGNFHESTATFTAPTVDKTTTVNISLTVYDGSNYKNDRATTTVTVNPGSGGGEYPAYVPGTNYKAGDKVSHNGSNYECKPWPATGWCSLPAYEPGHANGNWVNAWNKL